DLPDLADARASHVGLEEVHRARLEKGAELPARALGLAEGDRQVERAGDLGVAGDVLDGGRRLQEADAPLFEGPPQPDRAGPGPSRIAPGRRSRHGTSPSSSPSGPSTPRTRRASATSASTPRPRKSLTARKPAVACRRASSRRSSTVAPRGPDR